MGLLPPDPTAPEPFETLQVELQKPDGPKVRRDLPPGHVESDSRAAGSAPISAFMEESIDDDTQKFISQSLTDVDLFASYGLTQKAIGLLEAILRRAPEHTPTLEKLLDFVLGQAMTAAPPNSLPSSNAFIRSAATPPARTASENFAAAFNAPRAFPTRIFWRPVQP